MPDALGVARAWVRAQEIVPSGNVVFSVPEMDKPPLPLIVIHRVGGGVNHFLDSARLTFEVWAETKNLAMGIATQLAVSIGRVFDEEIFEFDGWRLSGAEVDQLTERPGVSWAKRSHVDAQFHIHM